MSVLAAIRPAEWELPLFVHVLGSLVLVGSLVTAAWFLFGARRSEGLDGIRWGWRTLLYAALPSFLVMRVSAQWLASEEDLTDSDAAWIGIGFMTTDVGAILLIAALVGSGLAVRRLGSAEPAAEGAATPRGATVAAWATSLLIVAYVVAIWAMTTKPI